MQKEVFLKKPRKAIALFYYYVVDNFGGPAFWDNKNEDCDIMEFKIK